MNESERMAAGGGIVSSWIMGVYAWLFALAFGATALDTVYARSIERIGAGETLAGVLNEVGDLLQLPLVLMIVAGCAALATVLQRRFARNLVIASLVVTLAPIPALVLFGDSLADAGSGTWLRLLLGAAASVLAMAAALSFRGGSRPSLTG